jgi:hypothetical protein
VEQNAALVILFRMQSANVDFLPADLSTPQGALEHLRDLFCPVLDEKHAQALAILYDHFIILVKEFCSPEGVQKIHGIAKGTGEIVHKSMLRARSREEDESLGSIAHDVRRIMMDHLTMMRSVMQEEIARHEKQRVGDQVDALEEKDSQGGKSDTV